MGLSTKKEKGGPVEIQPGSQIPAVIFKKRSKAWNLI